MAMKKVGGPARKEMRSRADQASACSGSKRRTRTERRPAAPGTRTPLSSPEMWAIGAGISTASAGPSPCTRAINDAFQLKPRWVCSTALGTPVEPDVKRTSATSEGRLGTAPAGTGAPPDRLGQRRGVGERRRVELQDEGGVDLAEGRRDVRRAEASAAPVPPRRRCASRPGSGRRPPGCWAPARPRPDRAGRPGRAARPRPWPPACRPARGREPGGAVDHLAAVGGEQGVQGGHVPGPPGLPVAAGLLGHPGRSEAGRHGRAPYPGPGIVTPMSGSWREPAWISR